MGFPVVSAGRVSVVVAMEGHRGDLLVLETKASPASTVLSGSCGNDETSVWR